MIALDPHTLRSQSIDALSAYHQHMCPPIIPHNAKAVIVNDVRYHDALSAQMATGIPAKAIKEACNGRGGAKYRTMDPRTHKPLIVAFVARYV